MTFAIVLGLSPTGLYAVRELGAGRVAVGGVQDGIQCAAWSNHLTIKPILSWDRNDETLVTALLSLADRRGERGILIPTSDSFIDFIARNECSLDRAYDFQQSYCREAVDRVVDKARFRDACDSAGVLAPRSAYGRAGDLPTIAESLSFPLLVKPALIHVVKEWMAGKKVFVVRNGSELANLAARIPPTAETDWLLQELVPGPESHITLFSGYRDRNGRIHQAFTCRKLRQFPPGFGSASLVESESLPETKEAATALLTALGHHGVAGVEFKKDERDGRLKVIEVNPRPSLWFAVGTAAGKCATLAAFRDMAGQPLPAEGPQQDGIRWRYGPKDLLSAHFYSRRGDFILPAPATGSHTQGRKMGAVFSWSDPLPAVREGLNLALKAVSRGRLG